MGKGKRISRLRVELPDSKDEIRQVMIVPVADAMDSWIWRECLDVGPGEEAVDLWELTPEVERIGLAQDKGPPCWIGGDKSE